MPANEAVSIHSPQTLLQHGCLAARRSHIGHSGSKPSTQTGCQFGQLATYTARQLIYHHSFAWHSSLRSTGIRMNAEKLKTFHVLLALLVQLEVSQTIAEERDALVAWNAPVLKMRL